MLQHAVSASSLVPVAGGHRDTIIQVKTIALWSILQHSRAMVVVVVVLYDEGCLTAVTSMNSSRGRVPALLNQHDGHHHAGRGGECAKWCLVCSLRDRTTAVGAKGLGWAIGSLCAPPLPPGRCQLLRVVGFPSIFAWKSVSAEFRGYAPAKLASAFLFEVVFFATREDNEGNRAYTVRGRSGDSVLMHLPVHTLNSISGVSDNGRD